MDFKLDEDVNHSVLDLRISCQVVVPMSVFIDLEKVFRAAQPTF